MCLEFGLQRRPQTFEFLDRSTDDGERRSEQIIDSLMEARLLVIGHLHIVDNPWPSVRAGPQTARPMHR